MQIHSYLTFNGNCREAMIFYRNCLGGELTFQTIGESPLSEKMPAKMKNAILHSTLIKEELILMASDIVNDKSFKKGNAVSLMLQCKSEKEIKTIYKRLSANGQPYHEPIITFQGSLLADLTDKFGNHWLLHFSQKQNGRSL